MRGHQHLGDPSLTQNQGNVLGDRPCVRQSRLYREHVGGNAMKELMGQDGLKWDTTRTQGVYAGGRAFDHNDRQGNNNNEQKGAGGEEGQKEEEVVIAIDDVEENQSTPTPQPQQKEEQQKEEQGAPVAGRTFRPGAGYANRQTYNIFTGE
ncbi:hypothetical protein LSM04_006148 [Trypanosoma melophagium]|uniref:uncharacterized protein n=1 Tax=Trypanosoma melophagium TaxID=715481 RepID=UPI00351A5DEB|nr:hypothetical protein LSM04_006148 [Trypanosoma melophagium]